MFIVAVFVAGILYGAAAAKLVAAWAERRRVIAPWVVMLAATVLCGIA